AEGHALQLHVQPQQAGAAQQTGGDIQQERDDLVEYGYRAMHSPDDSGRGDFSMAQNPDNSTTAAGVPDRRCELLPLELRQRRMEPEELDNPLAQLKRCTPARTGIAD